MTTKEMKSSDDFHTAKTAIEDQALRLAETVYTMLDANDNKEQSFEDWSDETDRLYARLERIETARKNALKELDEAQNYFRSFACNELAGMMEPGEFEDICGLMGI